MNFSVENGGGKGITGIRSIPICRGEVLNVKSRKDIIILLLQSIIQKRSCIIVEIFLLHLFFFHKTQYLFSRERKDSFFFHKYLSSFLIISCYFISIFQSFDFLYREIIFFRVHRYPQSVRGSCNFRVPTSNLKCTFFFVQKCLWIQGCAGQSPPKSRKPIRSYPKFMDFIYIF